MNIPIIVLAIVFLLIIIRQVGNIRLHIWQIMLLGALVVMITGQISLTHALKSVNIDVMLFLLGMFIVGQAVDQSGYLSHLSSKLFQKTGSVDRLMINILFGAAIASAFLMNDTLAIIGTPVMLLLARQNRISPKLLLLALAFAVTIGSLASPIGNPHNLLIAINGNIRAPFLTFLKFLLIPSIINLLIAYLFLRIFYKKEFENRSVRDGEEMIKDHRLAALSRISLMLLVLLVVAKVIAAFWSSSLDFRLTYIALIGCLPIIIFSPKRFQVIKRIDWATLIFFAAMFILMASVWESGFFQKVLAGLKLDITSPVVILSVSVLMSQLISNIPLVVLYMPILLQAGATTGALIALAAGSTIAGNFFILGAASNVIIIQNAEKKEGITLTFWEFARIGIPLTLVNLLVYWLFLR
ncbi:MAG: SLC13 family permease [candidate division Zixibacteria bacterium]|nr:SLC13 family permease [candidate division Zixibacteria bacterium]